MKTLKIKAIIAAAFILLTLFFSNDFGLIDIKKTAIITALAIDSAENGYEVTAQIAVPEATDSNNENKKAQISGSGGTIGAAIKKIGDTSGWFPNMQFCNVLIVGNQLTNDNVFKVLDYFSKTLRVQDSATVITTDGKAKTLLEVSTPLDNISSFALQKVLLKSPGFNRDVAKTDIKTFCVDYYSESKSSYMPIVTVEKADTDEKENSSGNGNAEESGGSQINGNGGGKESPQKDTKTDGKSMFNATATALFYDGVKKGELNESQTLVFEALKDTFRGTTIELNNVKTGGKEQNFLLTVFRCTPKLTLRATESELKLSVSLDVYCKITDTTSEKSDSSYAKNVPLPEEVKQKATDFFTDEINQLIEIGKSTGCDFLHVKKKLYRYNYDRYAQYKDNCLSVLKTDVNVTVTGQK